MGLDIAELMIAFEEEFKVDIFESDAMRVETVGEMIDMLCRRLIDAPTTPEEAERNHREGIRQAKEALSETLGIDESGFGEETLLKNLFPLEKRNEHWESIRCRFTDRLPELEHYFVWRRFLVGSMVVFVLGGIGNLFFAARFPSEPVFLATALLVAVALTLLVPFCRSRERTGFRYDCSNVKDLARRIVPDQVTVDGNGAPWTRETIERMLKIITAEQLGVKPEEVSLSMKFSEMF